MDNLTVEFVRRTALSASQKYRNLISPDEAIQLGLIAFMQSEKRWDGRGSLYGFASTRINGSIIDEVRKILRIRQHEVSDLYAPETSHHDIYEDPLNYWLESITDIRQKRLMSLFYSGGLTISEISEHTGITDTTVGTEIQKGIRTLQKKYCRTGW